MPSALSLGDADPTPVLVTLGLTPSVLWDSPHLLVPMTIFLNWVLSYLHIWLLWDHSWGRVWGSSLSLSSPQARPCASLLPWKAWAPKVLYVFIVTLY